MKNPHDIIIRPVLTEKSYNQMQQRKYTFIVDINANKIEIKKAIEEIFGVKVEKVNTMRFKRKLRRVDVHVGRTPAYKKTIVRLAPESKEIPFLEGMTQ